MKKAKAHRRSSKDPAVEAYLKRSGLVGSDIEDMGIAVRRDLAKKQPTPESFDAVLKRRTKGRPERVTRIDLGVEPDVGAPLPTLLRNEHDAWLAFYTREWFATGDVRAPPKPGESLAADEEVALLHFEGCMAVNLGFPNVDVLPGHRLWPKGLEMYGTFEVLDSQWIAHLDQIETVFPRYDPRYLDGLRHFVITFHDSVFECVANKVAVSRHHEAVDKVIARVVGDMDSGRGMTWTNPSLDPSTPGASIHIRE